MKADFKPEPFQASGGSPLDLDTQRLHVRHTLQRIKGEVTFAAPKSPTSVRTLKLPKAAIAALKRQRVAQNVARLAAGGNWRDHGVVFSSPVGTPLDHSHVTKEFKKLLKKAGLPDMRLHDLRHSCATLLLHQGVHPKLVQELLGHSQIALTLGTYTQVTSDLKDTVPREIDAVLTPKPPANAVSA